MKKIIALLMVFVFIFTLIPFSVSAEGYSTFYSLVFSNDDFIDRMLRGGVSSVELEAFLDEIDGRIAEFQDNIYINDADEYFIYLLLETLQKEEYLDTLVSFDSMYQEEMVYMLNERKIAQPLYNLMITAFRNKLIIPESFIPEEEEIIIPEVPSKKDKEIAVPFLDVQPTDWFADAVISMYEKGILSGKEDGLLHPNDYLMSGEAVKMLICAFLKTDESYNEEYGDSLKSSWMYPYVAAASHYSILNGVYDGEFPEKGFITRQDMATFVYRAIRKAKISILPIKVSTDFYDISDFKYYSVEPIKVLQQAGIVKGIGNNKFLPEGYLTRAEAIEIINNVLTMQ